MSALLQDPYFTRAGHEFSLTRIGKGSNDTAGRGREALVYGRINLLTGFTNRRRRPVAYRTTNRQTVFLETILRAKFSRIRF